MSGTTDLRIVKTQAAIRSRFLDLLLQKNFNEITVKDITQAANIGRGTFYLHYKDKFDLLDKVMREGLDATVGHFQPQHYFQNGIIVPERGIRFLSSIYTFFRKNERFFRAMLFNEGVPNFKGRLQQCFLAKFRREIGGILPTDSHADAITMEILPIFISSGMIGLIEWWFRTGRHISEQDMARRIYQVVTRGPLQTLGIRIDDRT
ncbi:TetR/AcrR family transcriptional regulator [Sporolactobacillus vineae]|uniref:TetR/AcrR family transcriptional regulator n=1 Tax=Sporolactobacillus vineae TaxID=444463 RepID=UPI0002F5408B|nr:TetR/AcrR family transcriptional regulator [Sporolactobacillus vineae]